MAMNDPIPCASRRAQAQGSARAFIARSKDGKARAILATSTHDGRAKLADWRLALAFEASEAMGDHPLLAGPLRISVWFVFPRPASHYLPANSRRPVPELREDAPTWHTSKPDVDKLARALLDALTLVVWRDDSQVCDLRPRKRYESSIACTDGPTYRPGAIVTICEASE